MSSKPMQPGGRPTLTQTEKQLSFRRAFEVIKEYRKREDFLAAYVVSFSVFEDRVTAAMMSALDLAGQGRPLTHTPMYKRIKVLATEKHIDAATTADWRSAGDERNALIHAAMWNVDVFSAANVELAFKRARRADAVARKLRGLVAKGGKPGMRASESPIET